MAKNRKAAEAEILKWVSKLDPTGVNTKMYKEQIFPALTNEAFDKWMKIFIGLVFLYPLALKLKV